MTRVIGALVACALVLGAAAWWLGTGDEQSREVVDVVTPAVSDAPAEHEAREAVVEPVEPERLVAPGTAEAAVARSDAAWLATGARLVTVHGTLADKDGPIEGVDVRVVNGLVGGFDTSHYRSSYGGATVSSASPDLAPFGARSDAIGHGRFDPSSIARVTELAPVRATTDAAGEYSFRAPLTDGAWIVFTCDGRTPSARALDLGAIVERGDGSLALEVGAFGHWLAPGVRMFGDVVDEDGAPLEGVEVSLVVTPDLCLRTTTDAAGRYEFPHAWRFARFLRFVTEGRPSHWHDARRNSGSEKLEGADGEVEAIHVTTFRFEPTGTRAGRVLGPDGEPLVGAEVLATPTPVDAVETHPLSTEFGPDDDSILFELECDVAWPTRRALTDADGRFDLEGLELDETYTVYARAVDLEPARVSDVAPQGDDELQLELSREDRLFVDVVDADGAPVTDATVRAWRVGHYLGVGRPIEVRAHGARFEVLGTGTQMTRLVVEAPGFAQAMVELEGRAGNPDGGATTVVLESELLLTAEVVDELGEPVTTHGTRDAALHVYAYPTVGTALWDGATRRVSDDGRAVWHGLEPGEYRVSLTSNTRYGRVEFSDAEVPATRTVILSRERGAEHVVFVVRRSGRLQGRLVGAADATDWERVEFVPVEVPGVPEAERPGTTVVEQARRRPNETFSASLLPGTWRVVVDGLHAGEHQVTAAATTTFEVQRDAPIEVVVRVVGVDGAPWVDARVWSHDAIGGAHVVTDDDGRVTLRFVGAGEVDLSARKSGRSQLYHHSTIDVTPQTGEVEWVVPTGGLRGRVHGLEVRGSLHLNRLDGRRAGSLHLDDDGSFSADDVPPGEYTASLWNLARHSAVSTPFTVEAGRTTEVELTALPGVGVEGSVWRDDPDGAKAAGVVAWRLDEPTVVHVAQVQRFEYEFWSLPSGRYRIAGFVDDLTGALDVYPTLEQRDWLAVTMAHVPITEVGDEPVVLDLPDPPIDARP